MTRSAIQKDNVLYLHDTDYPITFFIFKSGHEGQYLVVDEDPYDMNVKLRNTDEVLKLVRQFDQDISISDLPKGLKIDTTKENQITQNSTKENTI